MSSSMPQKWVNSSPTRRSNKPSASSSPPQPPIPFGFTHPVTGWSGSRSAISPPGNQKCFREPISSWRLSLIHRPPEFCQNRVAGYPTITDCDLFQTRNSLYQPFRQYIVCVSRREVIQLPDCLVAKTSVKGIGLKIE